MIVQAAVKIFDKRQNKEIIIPCHRHGDAFQILASFGYHRNIDFNELAQGFLDNNSNFYTRIEASQYMREHHQKTKFDGPPDTELYSEDLY